MCVCAGVCVFVPEVKAFHCVLKVLSPGLTCQLQFVEDPCNEKIALIVCKRHLNWGTMAQIIEIV